MLDLGKKELTRKSSIRIKQMSSLTFVNGSTFWVVRNHSQLIEVDCSGFVLTKTKELTFNTCSLPSSIYHGVLVTPDFTGKEYHLYYFFFTRTN